MASRRAIIAAFVLCHASGDDESLARLSQRLCNQKELGLCKAQYERCTLESGPVGDGYSDIMCACAEQYFGAKRFVHRRANDSQPCLGVCVRRAGCAATLMTQCIDTLEIWSCDDSSVCGSNCVNDHLIDERFAHVVSVNNYGLNYLRFSACYQRYNDRALEDYSMVCLTASALAAHFSLDSRCQRAR